jgi:Questin oxidase-like
LLTYQQALTLFATNYNFLHGPIDADFPVPPSSSSPLDKTPPPPPNATTSSFEIIQRIHSDPSFDGLFTKSGPDNIEPLFKHREKEVLDYFHQYTITDLAAAHSDINHLTALLLCGTHEPGHPEYDFFIVHLLTVSYAVRTLLPVVPMEYALPLVKMHWLFVIVVYIIQLRMKIRPELIDDVKVEGKGWAQVVQKCLNRHNEKKNAQMEDTHYLKGKITIIRL